MAEGSGEKISVSREALRAELSDLELRLVDRLANALELKADSRVVEQMELRMRSLEEARAAREALPGEILDLNKRVGALEKFRYAVPSLAVLSFLASLILTVYYITHL